MKATTHQLAAALESLAAKLKAKPDAACPRPSLYFHFDDKSPLTELVRVLQIRLEKHVDKYSVYFENVADALSISLTITRDKVCRKVQDEKWECEPILSPAEEQHIIEAGDAAV